MTIQWFPGHMAKARRQVTEKLKLIDVVIELLDARIPLSSRNPMIDEIISGKPRIVLLNKADLADEKVTAEWVDYFSNLGIKAMPLDSLSGQGVQKIPGECQAAAAGLMAKRRARGMKDRAIRTMILGIPNVGKSSLMNRLAGKKVAQTGDRPAVTKAQQWVKVGKTLEVLDTPGILWPKFEDPLVGLRLAASGAIKDEILDFQEIALFIIGYLKMYYPQALQDRYNLTELPDNKIKILEEIGRRRGCLVSGGLIDYDKAAELIVRELRGGKLGRISLERPNDAFTLEMARVKMDEAYE